MNADKIKVVEDALKQARTHEYNMFLSHLLAQNATAALGRELAALQKGAGNGG